VFGNVWLSNWSDDKDAATSIPIRNKYMTVYGIVGFFQSVAVFMAVIVITFGALRASVEVCEISFFLQLLLIKIFLHISRQIEC